jgi:hypothetical protein
MQLDYGYGIAITNDARLALFHKKLIKKASLKLSGVHLIR